MNYLNPINFNELVWISFLIIGIISYLGVGIYRRYAFWQNVLAYPSDRSNHSFPTPVGAGVIFAFIWFCVVYIFAKDYLSLFFPAIFITLVGYLDDQHNLSIVSRIIVQFFCALTSLWILNDFNLFDLINIVSLFIILWSINLFNFMDGLDGFATVEAIFIFLIGGLLFWWINAPQLALLAWVFIPILLGFLIWNWPQAKVFMGDAGSTFLGFIIAIFALIALYRFHLSIIYWMMLYSVFITDASLTLIRRLIKKQPWYQPHRLHAFQRLFESGFSRRQILFSLMGVNSIIALLVIISFQFPFLLLPMLMLNIFLVISIYLWIEKRKPMF